VHVRVDGSERDYAGVARFISSNAQFTPYYALTQDDRSRLSFLAEIDLPESEATFLPTGIPVQVTMDQP
jgi:HlyD family secretion protein